MLRLILPVSLLLAAAPASATDWRLAYTKEDRSAAMFVDLDNIVSREGQVRETAMYVVERENAADGTATRIVDLGVDCSGRRMMLVRFIRYDESGRQLDEYHGTRAWWGPFETETQPAVIIDFVCSGGASNPAALSWGAENPLERARARLRASRE